MHKIEDVILKRRLFELGSDQGDGDEQKVAKVQQDNLNAWLRAENKLTQKEYESYIRVWQLADRGELNDIMSAFMALAEKSRTEEGLTEAEQIEAKLLFLMVWEMVKPLVEAIKQLVVELVAMIDDILRSLPADVQEYLADQAAAKEARKSRLTGAMVEGIHTHAVGVPIVSADFDPALQQRIVQARRITY